MVTLGHGRDITPLLTSLALFKSFDVRTTEGAVVIGMVVSNSTDMSGFTLTVRDLAIDLVMSP